ncbi:MAG: TolC family outer membrane protein [Rickettsiales bacterium]
MKNRIGKKIAQMLTGAAIASLLSFGVAEAAPAISNFGYTLPYAAKGEKLTLAPNVNLSGNVRQVMLRFVNARKNANERLLVSNVAPNLRSYVKDNVLIIKGEGKAEDFQKVLRTLAYVSDSPAPEFGEQIVEVAVMDEKEASVMSKRIVPDSTGKFQVREGVEEAARIFPVPDEMHYESTAQSDKPLPRTAPKKSAASAPRPGRAPIIMPTGADSPLGRSPVGGAVDANSDKEALVAAMVAAYRTNEQLLSKRQELKVTDEFASQAFSYWMPTVSLNGQKGRSEIDRPGVNSSDVVEKYGADLNLPLFRGGRTLARMNREERRIEAGRYDLLNTEQKTLLDAVDSFITVWRDRNLLDLQKQNEAVLKSNLDDTNERFSLGEVTQTDVFQSETRYTRAIAERLRAEAALKTSEARYGRVVGTQVPVAFRYVSPESLHYFDREELRYDLLKNIAMQYHPLVKTAEFDLAAAGEDIDLKKGALLPTISLNASAQRESGNAAATGVESQTTRSLLFNIDVPLYQSGSEYSEVRQAKLTVEKLKFDLEERRQAVAEDLESSLEDLKASISSIENNGRQVEVAEKALQSVIYESQLGTRTTLDALDAQQEFLEAKILLVRAQHDEVLDTYRTLAGLGRLNSVSLQLPVDHYDPKKHYDKVRRKIIGY